MLLLPHRYKRKRYLTQVGEKLYITFCAGCHGFNDIAYYVNSPSFALGERLQKSDHELQKSI